jgi:hypothetical protein
MKYNESFVGGGGFFFFLKKRGKTKAWPVEAIV